MKKSLFFILAIAFCISLGAQSYTSRDLKNVTKEAYKTAYGKIDDVSPNFVPTQRTSHFAPKNDVYHSIGRTNYITVSNSNARNTISWSPDGSTCVAAWTLGRNPGQIRGTGLNYYNQNNERWAFSPDAIQRIEQGAAIAIGSPGWGIHVFTEQGECVLAHSAAAGGAPGEPGTGGLVINYRENYGEGEWQQYILKGPDQIETTPTGPVTVTGLYWPSAVAVGNTIHMVCITDTDAEFEGISGCPLYYRSTDGGRTWENFRTFNDLLPIEDLENIHTGDDLVITARDNHIVIAYANGRAAAYLESRDGGNTWTRTAVYECSWSWVSENVAVGPVISATTIGAAIGDDGIVHIAFSGQMRRRDPDTAPWYYTSYPFLAGMFTWKEGQPLMTEETMGVVVIDGVIEDWAFDLLPNYMNAPELLGLDEFRFWSAGLEIFPEGYNNVGYISHPRLIAQDGKVYLMYSSIVQQPMTYNVGGDETFFRGVFLTVSEDNGDTYNQRANTSWLSYHEDYFYYDWTNYIPPTGDDFPDGIEPIERSENGFPTMAINIKNDRLVFTWLYDLYPGNGGPWVSAAYQIFAANIGLDQAGRYNNTQEVWQGLWNSVAENNKIESLKIYPNPVRDRAEVEINTNAPYTLTVTNIMGQVVHTVKGQESKVTLNVANYPAGVYIVNVKTTTATASQKLIVK